MAQAPKSTLKFEGGCPDCGVREVALPPALPQVGDDFDWMTRDFDSFRRFMLEDLAARFPERTRWTPGDMEVVIIEVMAAVLDQISDMADRVAAEAYLETARNPNSVRRLLQMIGYDAALLADLKDDDSSLSNSKTKEEKLEALWRQNPTLMEEARKKGPRLIKTQKRMVTIEDYAQQLEEHPLVLCANASSHWSGSWTTLKAAVICWGEDNYLDEYSNKLTEPTEDLQKEVTEFHKERNITTPDWNSDTLPTIRTILRPYIEGYRMVAQEVILIDAVPVGIQMSISVFINVDYYQSEVKHAVEQALGTGPEGFFKPGRLAFGEDLHTSDIYEKLMSLNGIENVCLNRFKRFGNQYLDQSRTGTIKLDGLEVAVCDNNPQKPERGFYQLLLEGGRRG
ncbi:hypothetical protein CEE37_12275 [candidate division LCP-89 bacterium B3_LCP]|uniref:Baseplate protein J-like domain-containing protein n=1 Tax=candidate division LCP-89 bacterium B3_LCP TaxID=2012998 RepID=A0A532UUU8_UNCL8|nr:MAG: hypothetical protein CEE37_12275 [candidate division LCP-89 bacterium B3_LCP]